MGQLVRQVLGYYWQILRRAWADTWTPIREHLAFEVALVVALSVVTLALGHFLTGLAALGALLLALLILNVILSPVRLAAESEAERRYFADQLQSRRAARQVHQEFAALFGEGQALIDRVVQGGDLPEQEWTSVRDEWRAKVKAFLDECASASDAATWDSGYENVSIPTFYYRGASFTGDRGIRARQVERMLNSLSLLRHSLPTPQQHNVELGQETPAPAPEAP